MITENGTVKVRTVIDEKMQKEYSANSNKIALAMLIAGAAGTLVFMVLYVVSEFFPDWDDGLFFAFMIVFAVFLAGGIVLKVFLNKALQQVRNSPKVNDYEFFGDHFTVSQIFNGEVVATAKFYNAQITKIKDGKSYFYIFINQTQIFPVAKDGLDENEWSVLKPLFGLNGSLR